MRSENKLRFNFEEISPKDFRSRGELEVHLDRIFSKYEIHGSKLSEEQVWKLIERRGLSEFASAITEFIRSARKMNLDEAGLQKLRKSHRSAGDVETRFLEIGVVFYTRYIQELQEQRVTDFDGLIDQAIANLDLGKTIFNTKDRSIDATKIKHILIDEFQDFSAPFYRMLEAIRRINKSVNVFAVGDDWQAINRFTGSELRFFNDVNSYLGSTQQFQMSRNYRSSREVVDAGNAIMNGSGAPGIATVEWSGKVEIVNIDDVDLSPIERTRFGRDSRQSFHTLLRYVSRGVNAGESVTILARRNTPSGFYVKNLDELRSQVVNHLPSASADLVKTSTIHRFKGLEDHSVILVEGTADTCPLIHPNWIFQRVFGTTLQEIYDEEKRLFYVGVTRATTHSVILTSKTRLSPFVRQLSELTRTKFVDSSAAPKVPNDPGVWTVQVMSDAGHSTSPTRNIHKLLRQNEYSFNNDSTKPWLSYWSKRITGGKFAATHVRVEDWISRADSIVVKILNEHGVVVDSFQVTSGRCLSS
jgi:DNA helicase IV